MTAAGAPFSIREFAARSRSRARADGGCWPFGGDAGALPPVEVRRFRWWEDEAKAAAEDEVERRMAAKRRKRSVAELFAAVPRVARGQRCGKGKAGAKGKLGGKERGKGTKLVLPVPVRVKASNGNKKKKKEKNSGVKATPISISQVFQQSIRKKKPKNCLSNKKGNQEVSDLLDRKSKGNRKSVLERHKKTVTNSVQAQSICKHQSKAGFCTVLGNTDIRCKSTSCKSKHVNFSDGTDIFRWSAHLPEDNTEQPQSVQTSQQPTLEGHDRRNADKTQLVYQQADGISGAVENTSTLSENAVSAGVYRTAALTKPKDRTILGNSVVLNHRIETSNSSNCLNSISLARLSRKVPCQNFNDVDSHVDSDDGLSPDVECLGERNHMLSQASYTPASLTGKALSGDKGPLSQPSGSCLFDRSRSTLQERPVANYQVHPELLRSGKDAVRSINSSIGSNKPAGAQATNCVSAGRNMHFGDDYLGLPINSRGEFVKAHPGGTPNSADIFKRQCLGENSSSPSTIPTIFTPSTCTDHVNLRPNHHAQEIYTIDRSVFHADPRFTPTTATAHGMDFRQLPSSEGRKFHYYRIPGNKYPCTNQRELSVECFCSGCMGHHDPQERLIGMQSHCLSQNSGQNTQHNAETTMRLMGKTVTLGTSSMQCRGLSNEIPSSSNQTRAEDFQGAHMNVFPGAFHGGLADPPSACRISDRERQPSGTSHFSFVPAAIQSFVLDASSFRTNSRNLQPEVGPANNVYVHPAGEGELGQRQPVMENQVQSNTEDMVSGSMHRRHTQTVAPESSLNRRNSIRNFMEEISDRERQTSGTSHFSFVPATIQSFVLDTSSFRTNSRNLQPEVGPANNVYVHPAGEGEIGQRQPVMEKQVQSNTEDMVSGSMHRRNTQTVAPESSLNRRNSIRNFMEERPVPYQSSYLPQQFSRTMQRPPVSSFPSGYPIQNAPGLTTQTKFTSLRPLPPSVIPSQVYMAGYAPPDGSVTAFHPPVPVPHPASNHSAPGNAILKDGSMRWTTMGSKPEGLEQARRNCKRPAEQDGIFLTLAKKPRTAARKELTMSPFPEKGLEVRGSRPAPDPQARDMPICLDDDDEPEADLRLGNRESHATWSAAPANAAARPLKLKPGAKQVLQPSASGVCQESPWPVHSVAPLLAGPENGACTTPGTRGAAESYKF